MMMSPFETPDFFADEKESFSETQASLAGAVCNTANDEVFGAQESFADALCGNPHSTLQSATCSAQESFADTLFGVPFFYFDKLDSTNNYAKKYAEKSTQQSAPAIFQAGMQTNGRGRLGRSFYSPENSGIYISYLLNYKKNDKNDGSKNDSSDEPSKISSPFAISSEHNEISSPCAISSPFEWITPIAALAVCRTIDFFRPAEKTKKSPCKIKWVNDIFIDDKKVSGILTEGIANPKSNEIEKIVIGIGINLFGEFPQELKDIAGSCGIDPKKRQQVVEKLTENLFSLLCSHNFNLKERLKEYKSRSNLIGKDVDVVPNVNLGVSYRAKVLDINDKCHLLVQKLNGGASYSGSDGASSYGLEGTSYAGKIMEIVSGEVRLIKQD